MDWNILKNLRESISRLKNENENNKVICMLDGKQIDMHCIKMDINKTIIIEFDIV